MKWLMIIVIGVSEGVITITVPMPSKHECDAHIERVAMRSAPFGRQLLVPGEHSLVACVPATTLQLEPDETQP